MTKTCKNMSALGSCGLHNLHCGYPKCLTEDTMQPKVSTVVKKPDYVLINGMHFTHSEILKWREEQMARLDGETIVIKSDVAKRFIKAMDSLTDCMAASAALHIELKSALSTPVMQKPMPMPMARDCGCYTDEWSKFVTCFECYQKRND